MQASYKHRQRSQVPICRYVIRSPAATRAPGSELLQPRTPPHACATPNTPHDGPQAHSLANVPDHMHTL